LEPRALGVLGDYSFPGNVRELENLLASAMALAPEGEQTLRESQFRSLVALSPPEAPASADASLLSLEELERFAIQQALRVCEGNKSRAAELLGISRDSLYRKLKSYQLE
jgi:DNA-binding NtrC family response regulator